MFDAACKSNYDPWSFLSCGNSNRRRATPVVNLFMRNIFCTRKTRGGVQAPALQVRQMHYCPGALEFAIREPEISVARPEGCEVYSLRVALLSGASFQPESSLSVR